MKNTISKFCTGMALFSVFIAGGTSQAKPQSLKTQLKKLQQKVAKHSEILKKFDTDISVVINTSRSDYIKDLKDLGVEHLEIGESVTVPDKVNKVLGTIAIPCIKSYLKNQGYTKTSFLWLIISEHPKYTKWVDDYSYDNDAFFINPKEITAQRCFDALTTYRNLEEFQGDSHRIGKSGSN
jgi:outer membrane murein-binding lipoprotein Lpp